MNPDGSFDQSRQISARSHRQNKFRNLESENFLFHDRDSEPVDFFEFAPFFQLDANFDLTSFADRRNAEKLADIDNSKPVNFQEILNQFGRFSFELLADLFYQHRI